jgi:hypothetical protein
VQGRDYILGPSSLLPSVSLPSLPSPPPLTPTHAFGQVLCRLTGGGRGGSTREDQIRRLMGYFPRHGSRMKLKFYEVSLHFVFSPPFLSLPLTHTLQTNTQCTPLSILSMHRHSAGIFSLSRFQFRESLFYIQHWLCMIHMEKSKKNQHFAIEDNFLTIS